MHRGARGPAGGRRACRALEILPAGLALPASPSEALESPAMHALIEHALATYDLVILDTPPLGASLTPCRCSPASRGCSSSAWSGTPTATRRSDCASCSPSPAPTCQASSQPDPAGASTGIP